MANRSRVGHVAVPKRTYLVLLGLSAVVFRISALLGAGLDPLFGVPLFDETLYLEWADGFSERGLLGPCEPFHLSPLWTYLLAAWRWLFGTHPVAIAILQSLLGVATVLMTFLLARRFAPAGLAFTAALVLAAMGPCLFYETTLLADPLVACCSVLCALMCLRASESPGRTRWLLSYATLGLAIISRPTAMMGVPVVILATLLLPGAPLRSRLSFTVLGLVGCLALVGPVTLRNWLASGDLVAVTDSAAINFYIGNGPEANGTYKTPAQWRPSERIDSLFQEATRIAQQELGHSLSPREVRKFWFRQTLQHIRQQPKKAVSLLLRKIRLTLSNTELSSVHSYHYQRQFRGFLGEPWLPSAGWLTMAGILGLFLLFRRLGRSWPLILFGLLVPLATAVGFFIVGRFRLPWLPFFAIGSAVTAAELWRTFRNGRVLHGVGLLVLLALSGSLVFWPVAMAPNCRPDLIRAIELHRLQDPQQAIPFYLQAASGTACRDVALQNMGLAYRQMGDQVRAADWYRELAVHRGDQGDAVGAVDAAWLSARSRAAAAGHGQLLQPPPLQGPQE
ncbi:MAG: glycosyltransferase family 39 protein [Bradymonadales bacterium]|nr:glycosyltransferase family 39 protein [Bradymonadales bacterium]